MSETPEHPPTGLAKCADACRRPGFYAERALWKARRFRDAFRRTWLHAPPWVRACNRRRARLGYGPPNIYLETASGCNLRCPMCPTGAGSITRPHGLMQPALAEKLVAELRHEPELVGLWLGGEPLINPRLEEIVRILAGRNLPVGIHTNATLLTPERSRDLIDSGLRFVSFSIDSADAETYGRLRRGADLGKVVANIRAFLEVKRESGGALPHVTIQTVVPWEGEAVHPYGVELEAPRAVRALFGPLPVDRYHAIIAHAWSGMLDGNPLVAPNHVGVGRRMACMVPYTDLVIAWNGDAVTCCGDLDAQGVLGNLADENLYDLWNNERFRRLRQAMHTTEIEDHPLCGHCERLWTNPHRLDYDLRLALFRYRLRF